MSVTDRIAAQSRAVRARGPTLSQENDSGMTPWRDTRVWVDGSQHSAFHTVLGVRPHELAALADPTLERLLISGNQIEAVTGLEALAGLVMVDVSLNKLQSLAGLDGHPILVDLFASDNAIGGDLDVELDLMKTLPLIRTLVLRGNGVAAAESEPSYRHRVLYNLPTVLDLDGVQVLSEEKVAAQNAHGDNTELLAAVSAKYFPPGNPCEIELFPGEFGQAEA